MEPSYNIRTIFSIFSTINNDWVSSDNGQSSALWTPAFKNINIRKSIGTSYAHL
jgi:hypothetical protein